MPPSAPNTESCRTSAGSRVTTADSVQTRVRDVLLELMIESESDSVRVAAAKALIDKILKDETPKVAEAETAALEQALLQARDLLQQIEEKHTSRSTP